MDDLDNLQILWRGFAAHGELPALVAFRGNEIETWSFAELGKISARLAAGLLENGLGRGDGVALVAPNSPRWIAAFWGIVAAGGAAVPLDAQNNDRELVRMLKIGACRFAFVAAELAARLSTIAPPSIRAIIIDCDSHENAGKSWRGFLGREDAELPTLSRSDIAVVAFTSGTTGSPKAVPLTHANLLTNVAALATTHLVGPGDRALLPLPLYHAYPLTIGMITPLALGCAVVLPGGISGPELLHAMRQGEVTVLVGVPRLYTALVDNLSRGIAVMPRAARVFVTALLSLSRYGFHRSRRLLLAPLRRRLAPQLRLLVSGGASVPIEVERTLDALGWEMLTGYGLVETSSMLTFNPPGEALPGAAGRPVPGMEIRIAGAEPDGVGDIEARGPSLFSGYRDDPEKTREALTTDGWFRTGDLGSIDRRGYLHVTARKVETIVLADGKKLFPEPFEAVYGTAPLVREIALLAVDGALVGLVVPDLAAARDTGAMRLADALREGLTAAARPLPPYARLSGFAVTHEALPRTQLGKVRRHLLPALYAAARHPEAEAEPAPLSDEDRSLLEQPATAAVWRWLQQRFPRRSLHPDTILQIDLGIDSLGWVELTLALERDLGLALREEELARIATIRDLLRETGAVRHAGTEVAAATSTWLAPLNTGLRILRAIGEGVIRIVMRGLFQLSVDGLDCLPSHGPALICPNHVSYIDPFAVGVALPRRWLEHSYWAGWSGIAFSTRLRRLFSRAARVIPIDPDRATGSGLMLGRVVLERGWNLVWFPEGARSLDGKLQRFLPGIGALVEEHVVPIIPVYVGGSFAAWPATRRLPRLSRISVRFGRPILPDAIMPAGSSRERDEQIAAAVRAAVADLAR